jgi:serine kinase of HPr protein (carbohydrate metabolism regulator)
MTKTSTQAPGRIHATAIALEDGRGALILGPPGAGKSDLALRCILQGAWIDGRHCGAMLVADDQVIVERTGADVVARPPETIAGRMEVRGIGIVAMPHVPVSKIVLAVELVDAQRIERLPDPAPSWPLLGVEVPLIRVAPFEASAHLKVLLALARIARELGTS